MVLTVPLLSGAAAAAATRSSARPDFIALSRYRASCSSCASCYHIHMHPTLSRVTGEGRAGCCACALSACSEYAVAAAHTATIPANQWREEMAADGGGRCDEWERVQRGGGVTTREEGHHNHNRNGVNPLTGHRTNPTFSHSTRALLNGQAYRGWAVGPEAISPSVASSPRYVGAAPMIHSKREFIVGQTFLEHGAPRADETKVVAISHRFDH